MIGIWLFAMVGIILLISLLYVKFYRRVKAIWFVAMMFVIYLVLITLTMRVSAILTGVDNAWQNGWIYLIFNLLFIGLNILSHNYFYKFQFHYDDLANILTVKQQEIEMLKGQLNPHYIFNTFNNLAATIMVDKDMALDYTYKLSDMLRFQMNLSKQSEISLNEEVKFIRNFLEIEKLRLGPRCSIKFLHNIAGNNISIPPLLLFPLVESALQRSQGLQAKPKIKIVLEETVSKTVRFEVSNSFKKQDINHKQPDFDWLRQRLKFSFKNGFSLVFEEKEDVQTTILTLNLQNGLNKI
jgi:LytS/YehU family sensor histidine kinase